MRVRHSKTPLPRDWRKLPGADSALYIGKYRVRPKSRLDMAILVFKNGRDLARFARLACGQYDLNTCQGAVINLAAEVRTVRVGEPDKIRMQVDPKYFCAMLLLSGHLTTEVIAHEAVHAAFAYVKRVKRNLWAGSDELDEENVCYPAGRIASAVTAALVRNNFQVRP